MRKIWIALIMLVLSSSLLLYTYIGNRRINVELSPEEKNITDLTTREYTYDELSLIVNYSGDINSFNTLYPIECIRHIQEVYRVAYRGKDHVAIVYFDGNGTKTRGKLYSCSVTRSFFCDILGHTLSEVMEIDPSGDYTFLYTGRNDNSISRHVTADGFIINVTYNSSKEVVDVQIERI